MNKEVAQHILADLLSIESQNMAAFRMIRVLLKGEEAKNMEKVLLRVSANISDGVSLIVTEHPELRPPGLDE